MRQTLQDQLSLGLLRLGMVELKKTTKYRRFHCPKTGYDFFVGRAGALRVSRNCKATMTTVVGDRYRAQVLEAGSNIHSDPSRLGF